MASPYDNWGAFSSDINTTKDVDVLNEKLLIQLTEALDSVTIQAIYTLYSNRDLDSIPIFFVAHQYESSFSIFHNSKRINTIRGSYELYQSDTLLQSLCGKQDSYRFYFGPDQQEVFWEDIQFFYLNLKQGKHEISVRYNAKPEIYRGDWVKQYTLKYALYPAKFWQSFKKIQIEVKNSVPLEYVRCNLDSDFKFDQNGICTMNFKGVPEDYLILEYQPKTPGIAQAFIHISPQGLGLILWGILMILHLLINFSLKHRIKKVPFNWILLLGALIIPLIVLIAHEYFYGYIDDLIGDYASRYHGYTFFVFIFYPFMTFTHWGVVYLVNFFKPKKELK